MKKFGKFLLGTVSIAAAVGGLYCLYKNSINKKADDDFDDFDDAMMDDETDSITLEPEDREYVSIDITSEAAEEAETVDTEANDVVLDTAETE
ncbi:MAG: hypothetical protein IJY09_00080 [Lachnospiraceae bacterium]|nr:hypothetical protein [Lachnospiraceae bacterium]